MHRYRAQARATARDRAGDSTAGAILPITNDNSSISSRSGGLKRKPADCGRSVRSLKRRDDVATNDIHNDQLDGNGGEVTREHVGSATTSTLNDTTNIRSPTMHHQAPSSQRLQHEGSRNPTLEFTNGQNGKANKPPTTARMRAGSIRFIKHTKDALFHSWVNVLLVFVPIGIVVKLVGMSPTIIFAMNAIAIIPLAGLLAHATERVAARLGDSLGALLNVTFGNAVELIIFIIALIKNEIRIVQASLLGSILANLLLILGMAFLLGGLKYREQIYNSTVTQMSACLLSLSVMSLLLPTAFHASFNDSSVSAANKSVLKVSRGTSVILLLVYGLYLVFQLKSHAYMYESTPQNIIDEESHPGVFANMLDSSSPSDSAGSSDSSDSGVSGSTNTASKRLKRVWMHRKRRKSSASESSTNTAGMPSVIGVPSTEQQGRSLKTSTLPASRRGSALHAISSHDEDEAENGSDGGNRPRVRDFGGSMNDSPISPPIRKHRKKEYCKECKKHHKRHGHSEQDLGQGETPASIAEIASARTQETPRVGFAHDIEVVESPAVDGQDPLPAKRGRQLSARTTFRPALPKMLSQTVFTQPSPYATTNTPSTNPPSRFRGACGGLRRASSLPERLNHQANPTANATATATRTDPIPPYQHQRPTSTRNAPSPPARASAPSITCSTPKPIMSRTAAVVLLLLTTTLVAICAEFMVTAIPTMITSTPTLSSAFIGLIILPIVGNAAEHVTAVVVATKNKMDLAIGVAVGSSIQIALFVTPLVVLLGWCLDRDMSLYFNLFETICLFVTAFVVNFLVLDGRSNYLEGALLVAAYFIVALGAFYYPDEAAQSEIGGGNGGSA